MRGAAGAEQPPRVLLPPTKAKKKRELRFVHIPKNTGTFVEHLGKAHPGAVAGWGMNDIE